MKTNSKIDREGRVLIPITLRNAAGIKTNSKINIQVDNGKITIEAETDTCKICGGKENLTQIETYPICQNCINKIKNN
jgi:bifunctional DNA-binding transcriptional regulator/antitoxin component of YhaV-PrlF toxin-antitoxin module